MEVIGAKPIILGHDRTQPRAWLPCLGAKQNSLFNPKHQITDLKLRGKGGILPRWREMVFCPETSVQTPKLAAPAPRPLKSRNLAKEGGFRRSYIFAGVGIY